MLENFRQFEVTDPFGRPWKAEFRWLQNAISIRHADGVDCKFFLTSGDEKRELVVALPHPDLLAIASERKRELTDAWCMKMAALHTKQLLSTWEDMDKTIVTPSRLDLERHNLELERAAAAAAESAILHH